MCGIAGGVALRVGVRPDHEIVRRMTRAVRHRGPDDEGFWESPSGAAFFGHRRLSVIDLETGRQPLVTPDDSAGLVFNGEIYNYVELRTRLEAANAGFTTESDTEVLLQAIRQWGDDAVQELIGMFAFAYWDDAERRLTLVRDRVGKKPLYYVEHGQCLYFCSTFRGLEQVFPVSPELDTGSIADFLDLGYIPAPDTVYRGVHKLPAATRLSASFEEPDLRLEQYWDVASSSGESVRPETAADELAALLEDAVRLRLRSDVPLGVFLSGGVDSSLVAAVAGRLSSSTVSTFTVGFDAEAFDEAERARRIADHLGTDHHEYRVHTDVLELLPQVVDHFGEPYADSSALPVWRLAEAARREITVALMGDGGDEGFAGYDWYRTALRLGRMGRFAPSSSLARSLARPFGHRARRLAFLATAPPAERFANLRCMFGRHALRAPLFAEAFRGRLDSSRRAEHRLQALYESVDLDELRTMQYVDIRSYLPGDLLPKVDVATMAHGLEARAPLLDHRILEFAFRVPSELHRPDQPKALLKTLLRRYLPAELTEGPKKGFSVPLRDWFRGELRPLVEALPQGALMDTGWFNRRPLRELVEEHLAGRRDNSVRLYHLLALELWLERR